MSWDTVVVGSGPGGLAAAAALSLAGQRVLVLEQHYLPGGWAHSFNLNGYRFSPGIHYVGELHDGGSVRSMLDSLGVGKAIEWRELNPDGFDHFIIGAERVDQPRGFDRWLARLSLRFPSQREGLTRVFAVLRGVVADLRHIHSEVRFPAALALPFRLPSLVSWGLRSYGALLDEHLTDPLLRAVLSAQSGNHGLPPSEVPVAVHAMMAEHYFEGAWYPRGGARSIPLAYIRTLQARGSRVRVKARVKRIVVEHGRAAGVELEGGERIDAGAVVCNADPAIVYGQLLDERYCSRERRRVDRSEYSAAIASAFCAVDLNLDGFDAGNYWWYRDTDVNGVYERIRSATRLDGELDALFLTVTTLKDPGHAPHGHHVVELLSFVPWEAFQGLDRGDAAYLCLKRELQGKLLRAAEHVMPGITSHLKMIEVGTPLTNGFYCNVHQGAAYGTAKTRWQIGPFGFSQRGPVPGLFLCGASTLSHGFAGATASGLIAAQHVLGREELLRAA